MRSNKELILLGKRHVIENEYKNIHCWECPTTHNNAICNWCTRNDNILKFGGATKLKLLSDENVEALYEEIASYE